MSFSQQQAVSNEKVQLAGLYKYMDSGYNVDSAILRDDSTLETNEYELKPIGDVSLESRFANESDVVEFQHTSNKEIYDPSRIHFRMTVRLTAAAGAMQAADLFLPTLNVAEIFNRGDLEIAGGTEKETIPFIGKANTVLSLLYKSRDHINSVGTLTGFIPNVSLAEINKAAATDAANYPNNYTLDRGTLTRMERWGLIAGQTAKATFDFQLNWGFFLENKKYSNLPFTVRLYRANDNALIEKLANADAAAKKPSIVVERLSMFIPVLRPEASTFLKWEAQLRGDYLLQYNTIHVERKLIPNGHETDVQTSSLPSIPSKAFVVFQNVSRSAALTAAAPHLNPSIFDNNNIQTIQVIVNNAKRVPFVVPDCDFTTAGAYDYALVMHNTLTACNQFQDYNGGGIIDYANFKKLYPIYGFNLDNGISGLPELNKSPCNLEFNIKYRAPPGADMYMYIVYIYNSVVSITGSGTDGVTIAKRIYGGI